MFSSSFDRSGCVKESLHGLGLTKAWWIWPFVIFANKAGKTFFFFLYCYPAKHHFAPRKGWLWIVLGARVTHLGLCLLPKHANYFWVFFLPFVLPRVFFFFLIYCASALSEVTLLSGKKIFLISCHNKQSESALGDCRHWAHLDPCCSGFIVGHNVSMGCMDRKFRGEKGLLSQLGWWN